MKKRNILVALLSVICMASIFGFSVFSAYAGDVTKEILNDGFSSGSFASSSWYSRNDYKGTSFSVADSLKLTVKNGAGENGVNSKISVSADDVTLKLDIDKLVIGNKDGAANAEHGWFGVAYNMPSADTAPYHAWQDASTGADGLYFKYSVTEQKLLFASFRGQATSFVDGNGSAISKLTQYNFYDASALTEFDGDKVVINRKTVYFTFDKNGNMEIKMKALDSNDQAVTVIKTASASMYGLVKGKYVGIGFAEASKKLESAEISGFEVSTGTDSNKTVLNDFKKANQANWNIVNSASTDELALGLDSALSINSDFSADYPIIMGKEIKLNDYDDAHDSEVVFDTTVKSLELGANSEFGFVFGLSSLSRGKLGDANTTFVYFYKDGSDLKIGAKSYDAEKTATELFTGASVTKNAETGFIDLSVKISHKGRLTVINGGATVYASEKDNEAFAVKYGAIALSGESTGLNAVIKSVKLTDTFYDRPENSDINEQFTGGGYNKNEWNLVSTPYLDTYTNSAYVKDEKLFFDNCAMNSAFITKYQYSDFEIQFDIDDIRREVVGNGATKAFPISSFIGVYWGTSDEYHLFGNGVATSFPLVYIAPEIDQKTWDRAKDDNGKIIPTSIYMLGNGMGSSFQLSDHYDFWLTENEDKVLQFKLTVTGKTVAVAVKYTDETEWCTVDRNGKTITLDMDAALTGNVAITTMGNNYYVKDISEGASCGHFSVDNILLTNKDDGKNTVIVDYLTSKTEKPQDYEYTKPDNDEDYKPVGSNGGSGCSSEISAGGIVLPIAVLFAAAVVLKTRRCKDE